MSTLTIKLPARIENKIKRCIEINGWLNNLTPLEEEPMMVQMSILAHRWMERERAVTGWWLENTVKQTPF